MDQTNKTDTRMRLETNEDTINSDEITLDTIQQNLDISLLQKRQQNKEGTASTMLKQSPKDKQADF